LKNTLIENSLTALTTHLANMTAASIAAAQPVVPVSNVKTTALKRKASAGSRGVEVRPTIPFPNHQTADERTPDIWGSL